MNIKKIAIGSDHAGFELKAFLKTQLPQLEIVDMGTHSNASVDYPDFAHPVATAVENQEVEMAILICGSANGIAITANKHQHVRAAICWMEEIATLARQHNDANIVCLPARFISKELALAIVNTFLSTDFEGGRHQNRVNKIACSC